MQQIIWPPLQGEYRGDFTRDSFAPFLNFSRVLMQQGRVTVDADWNEQTDILLNLIRTLTADLLGPHAGTPGAFKLTAVKVPGKPPDLSIGSGRYYVNGLPCENKADPTASFREQPYFRLAAEDHVNLAKFPFLAYLDLWERHVTGTEAEGILEPALEGVDTATRAQVMWQVKLYRPAAGETIDPALLKKDADWAKFVAERLREAQPRLKAWVAPLEDLGDVEPCPIPADAGYRGLENQLYRVEIHTAGDAATARFKWSRNNSSEEFPVKTGSDKTLQVTSLGRDDMSALRRDQWVEFVTRDNALAGRSGMLLQVSEVDTETLTITPAAAPTGSVEGAVLRHWDHVSTGAGGALPLDAGKPVDLEKGIQVQFDPAGQYHEGEYWLVPARTATRDIIWERDESVAAGGEPAATWQPPHGPAHHYAPLAYLKGDADITDLRREITNSALWKAV